jgi:hypothetical protein
MFIIAEIFTHDGVALDDLLGGSQWPMVHDVKEEDGYPIVQGVASVPLVDWSVGDGHSHLIAAPDALRRSFQWYPSLSQLTSQYR